MAKRSRPTTKQERLLQLLHQRKPATQKELAQIASEIGLSKRWAAKVANRTGHFFGDSQGRMRMDSGLPTWPARADRYVQELPGILKKYNGFLYKVAKPLLSLGVPWETVYDSALALGIGAAKRYNPNNLQGKKFSTFVTESWKRFLVRGVSRYYFRYRRIFHQWDFTSDTQKTQRRRGIRDPRRSPTPVEDLLLNEEHSQLQRALAGLTKKERFVIEHRFGLNDQPVLTLEEIGKAITQFSEHEPRRKAKRAQPYTKEAVRLIQYSALTKLRQALADYVPLQVVRYT
jgi:hypothetical protein